MMPLNLRPFTFFFFDSIKSHVIRSLSKDCFNSFLCNLALKKAVVWSLKENYEFTGSPHVLISREIVSVWSNRRVHTFLKTGMCTQKTAPWKKHAVYSSNKPDLSLLTLSQNLHLGLNHAGTVRWAEHLLCWEMSAVSSLSMGLVTFRSLSSSHLSNLEREVRLGEQFPVAEGQPSLKGTIVKF